MFAAITGRFFKSQSERLPRFAASPARNSERPRVQQNTENSLTKGQLSVISTFVGRLIPHVSHLSHSFDHLPRVYHDLATVEVAKESGVVSNLNRATDVKYTLTMDAGNDFFHKLNEVEVSVVELEGEGRAVFCKKLVYAAERVVISCSSCYHIADVQYLLYLVSHLDQVPRIMKNGKGNIFAGTTIAIGDVHYVPVATWAGGGFNIELLSLDSKVEDVAQFVIIEKNP